MKSVNHLKELRLARGLAQQALAVRARVSAALIVGVERHGHRPSDEVQRKIANALDVTPAEIWPLEFAGVAGAR